MTPSLSYLIKSCPKQDTQFIYTGNINNNTTTEFQYLLSLELRDNVFSNNNNNTNDMFNNFHSTYLRVFMLASQKHQGDSIITKGIIISCHRRTFFTK
jgi:hypothetical protein